MRRDAGLHNSFCYALTSLNSRDPGENFSELDKEQVRRAAGCMRAGCPGWESEVSVLSVQNALGILIVHEPVCLGHPVFM